MEDFGLILKSLCGRGFETHLISADLVHRPQSWIIPSKVPPLAQPLALVREISARGTTLLRATPLVFNKHFTVTSKEPPKGNP